MVIGMIIAIVMILWDAAIGWLTRAAPARVLDRVCSDTRSRDLPPLGRWTPAARWDFVQRRRKQRELR